MEGIRGKAGVSGAFTAFEVFGLTGATAVSGGAGVTDATAAGEPGVVCAASSCCYWVLWEYRYVSLQLVGEQLVSVPMSLLPFSFFLFFFCRGGVEGTLVSLAPPLLLLDFLGLWA